MDTVCLETHTPGHISCKNTANFLATAAKCPVLPRHVFRLLAIKLTSCVIAAVRLAAIVSVTCLFAPLILTTWLAIGLTKWQATDLRGDETSLDQRVSLNAIEPGVVHAELDSDCRAWIADMEYFDRF